MSLARAARHIPDSPWTVCWDSPSDWLQKQEATNRVSLVSLFKTKTNYNLEGLAICLILYPMMSAPLRQKLVAPSLFK